MSLPTSSMVLNSVDKEQMSALQGLTNNMNDDRRSTTRWRNPPTPVMVPTLMNQQNPTQRLLSGPFGTSRMKDTMSTPKGSSYRHPVKDAKLSTSSPHSTGAKRRKMNDHTFQHSGPSHAVRQQPKSTQRKDKHALVTHQEPISVDSDEEDLGQPVRVDSSDPLNISNISEPGPSSGKPLKRRNDARGKQPFEVNPDDPTLLIIRGNLYQTDTTHSGCREKWADEIHRPHGNHHPSRITTMNRKSSILKKRAKANRVDDFVRKRTASNSGPHIDLRNPPINMKATPNLITSVKRGMKPRDPKANFTVPIPQRDVEATSPSGFTSGKRTGSSNSFELQLPVKEWFLGFNHLGESYKLSFRKNADFTIRGYGHSETVKPRDATEVVYSRDDHPGFTLQTTQEASALGVNFSHFQPDNSGGRGKSMIVVLFDREAVTWSDQTYDEFCKFLKARYGASSTTQAKYWEAHIQRYQVYQQSEARKDTSISRSESPSDVHDDVEETGRPPDNGDDGGRSVVKTYKSNSRRETPATNLTERSSSSEPRRSSRVASARTSARTTPQVDPDEVILSYPANTPGSVNITNADLSRLEPGEYLNDTLIEFGLRLWHRELEETDPDLAKRIHIFNSFFYKKLSAKKSNPEEGYQSVRRWTSKFDLFKKDFIIIPINEAMHWYLAIIYHPGHILFPPPEKPAPTTRVRTRNSNANEIVVKDDDAQEVQDVEDVEEALVPPDGSKSEPSAVENEDDILNFETSVSTHYVDNEPPISNSASPAHMEVTEEPPLSPNHMDVDEEYAAHSRARSATVSDDDKPTSSTVATVGGTPHSVTDELSMDVDDMTLESGPEVSALSEEDGGSGDVNAASASKSDKGKVPEDLFGDDGDLVDELVDELVETDENATKPVGVESANAAQHANILVPAYICTLDSLGTRHPSVTRSLSKYLQLEARSRKETEKTSDPLAKTLLVPVQPNYSDCGIYLLHFAQTFVSNPDYYCNVKPPRSSEDRKHDWAHEGLLDFREKMRNKILELSEEWKRDRAAQDEAKKQQVEKGGQPAAELIEDSDSDDAVIIEDPPDAGKTSTKKGGRGGRANQSRGRAKPTRLRG
ncbi:hypothetical protein D9758_002595 [Tetrapyrgos nigripes]|uniref:Ubiquitin-like protease family profile domain-containing protein n=1 Tax=Tetrapyrgos nigripes TaxID=182062 RepID=A0A8H5GRB7_9AGAR|nr:hypothetical protein D9758_002595 [Tetrapyrgos nigripes]